MMKKPVPLSPRAALFIGAALLATPAFAQDAQQQVTPPPITAPAPPLTPAPAPAPTLTLAPPVVQPSAPATAARARPAATATHAARTVTHARTTTTTRATAPAETAAPAPAPAPAPVEQTLPAPAPAPIEPQAATPVQVPAPEQVAPAPAPAPVRTAGPIWPWLLGGAILVIGALALLLRRRRPEYDTYAEEYVPEAEAPMPEPVIAQGATPVEAEAPPLPLVDVAPEKEVREPVVAAVAEDATIAEPDAAELAEVTEGAVPVGHRPWIELGIRPVRAGTSEEEALVEIELTVGNAGDMPAKNVRISTFMLAEGESSEIEQLLVDHNGETSVPPMTIKAGEGTRVDTTLAVPKGELGRTFNPLVVADARYKLPDGSEGRTSATFRIGRPAGEGGIGPIGSSRPHMVEDVEAELDQLLERA